MPYIDNTGNQNTVNPLYIRRFYTQPSHRFRLHVRRIQVVLATRQYFPWHGIKYLFNAFTWNTHQSLVFSWNTHSPRGSCVFWDNREFKKPGRLGAPRLAFATCGARSVYCIMCKKCNKLVLSCLVRTRSRGQRRLYISPTTLGIL